MELLQQAAGPLAVRSPARYERHRAETTLLYELVDQHYPAFVAALEQDGRTLPAYVQQEFAAYLKCGRLEHGFLRVRCTQCHAERLVAFSCKRRGFCPSCGARRMVETAALLVDEVLPRQPLRQWVLSVPFPLRFLFATEPAALTAVLRIVYRAIATHLTRKAGLTRATAQAGAVTLIQRFGSALNLNIHFHLLVLDGVYVRGNDRLEFRRVPPPTKAELDQLLKTLTSRIGRHLERRGWLTRDAESSHLNLDREGTTMDSLLGHSITYRIALGPRAGQKAFTLQSLPSALLSEPAKPFLASADGFSLHAGVSAGADDRKKVERLCRYIARPPVATGRLSLTTQGQVRYTLKTPYRDGTTHVVFEPLDFMARLAALVPKPRAHLTRYHGVFAPHSRWRAEVTPKGRGKITATDLRTPAERHRAMRWAQRLKRVFGIEIESCEQCGGKVRVIASIEDPAVIGKILGHLASRVPPTGSRPPSRGPPQGTSGLL
jgi:hypothetical protein